jgi:diaminopimelate decarboxylase
MVKFRSNLDSGDIEKTLKAALSDGLIREEDSAAIFYDLSFWEERLKYLVSCFPASTLHGLAVKANPLMRVMELAQKTGAMLNANIGVEAASLGEVTLALKSGYRPDQVVYDSPVKTIAELEFALKTGIHLNVDNLDELERVNNLLKAFDSESSIGIRINPQVGVGTILESSVAGEYSKFGVPIGSRRKELTEAFLKFPWLRGMHLHVGSQGCAMELLVNGIGVLYDFALELNEKRLLDGFPPIDIFDIGGGLPISYHSYRPAPLMEDYVASLKKRAPALFSHRVTESQSHQTTLSPCHPVTLSPHFRLITEFGRWTYTNAGWTISRVEYVKHDPGIKTAMIHVGAELFIRECLNPTDWQHEYSLFDRNGNLKSGTDPDPYNLAGPLCFSGDILAKGVTLPVAEEGDYLVIHDTGGYTFSMWSHYNSRQTPRILGYCGERFEVLKERQELADVGRFWE